MTRDQFDSIVNDQMVFLSNASQIRKNLEQTRKPYFGPPEIGIPLLHEFLKGTYPFIQVSVLIYCYNVTLSSCYARVTILTTVIKSTMELNSFSSSLLLVLRKNIFDVIISHRGTLHRGVQWSTLCIDVG